MSDADLAGKVAIVTGGGQGVGRGIAIALARAGAAVVVAERNERTGAQVAEEVRALGPPGSAVVCDVYQQADIDAAVAATVAAHGTVDILVNNAQDISGDRRKPLVEVTAEDMGRQYESGVLGTLRMMQACFPHLRENGGRIINMGSAAGVEGFAMEGPYAASKEAIRALSRVAAREWGQFGITVNVICPAAATPATSKVTLDFSDRPIARWGDPELDIGGVAVFLAGNASAYITGHTFMVDGGARMDAGR